MKKLDGMSMDIEKNECEKLKAVFPECFVEDKLDIDKLLNMCGEYITNDFEKYKFEWKGKCECFQIAQKRTTGTLRPCKEESVNFDTTQNLYIEGDNLEVLKILQRAYYRQVKMIYIDPPYNTGNDFVYKDDFKDPMAHYKEVTGQTTKSNPESMGRFHTNWLNMMYPRLRLAANLLRDDGVIFISIGENEVYNLKKLCDETFGEENFIAKIIWQQKSGGSHDEKHIVHECEYIFVYARQKDKVELGRRVIENDTYKFTDSHVESRGRYSLNKLDRMMRGEHYTEALNFPVISPDGSEIWPGGNGTKTTDWNWRWSKTKVAWGIDNDFLVIKKDSKGNWSAYSKQYEFVDNNNNPINRTYPYRNLITSTQFNTRQGGVEILNIFGSNLFDYAKPFSLIQYLMNICNLKDEDIILDFFSGSATTAHAVMQLNAEDALSPGVGGNRKFIMVQLPELCDEKSEAYKAGYKNICEIGKERIRRAGAKLLEKDNQITLGEEQKPLDVGFKVFKLDTSNLKTWDSSHIKNEDMYELYQRLNDMVIRIKADRTDLDVVYEIMLKLGVPLTYSVTPIDVLGKKAYSIGDDCLLLVCLDKEITPEVMKVLVEYAPGKIVMSDGCFEDNTAMSNAYYILQDVGIDLKLI